jgi:protein-S-isoprenylcysteine O-methyltransferase Ste14
MHFNEHVIFNNIIIGWFTLAVIVFISLFFLNAPYGRFARHNWGLTIDPKIGWLIMEIPAPLVFLIFFLVSNQPLNVVTIIFLLLWQAHYIHRSFIYPLTLRGQTKRMTVIVVAFAFIFNILNGYLNGRYIFTLSGGYANEWMIDPRFLIGLMVFIAGFIINRQADLILHSLRAKNESGYRIPYGGMYRWVSCPNYLGEILIWSGWAIITWSLPGLAFAVWTIANLVPRAKSYHLWYQQNFPSYPTKRKALIPWLW